MKKRIPLVFPNTSRIASSAFYTSLQTDSRIVNGYIIELLDADGKKKYGVAMRPGLATDTAVYSPGGYANAVGRGIFSADQGTTIFWASGNTLYKNTTVIQTITNSGITRGDFAKVNSNSTNNYIGVLGDGFKGYLFNAAGAVLDMSGIANFPFGTISNLVCFSNYVFVINLTNNRIYNSNLSDYTAFQALSYQTSQTYGDKCKGLGVWGNYLVVFKEAAMEFWQDIGTSPSPIQLVPHATQRIGSMHRTTIQEIDGALIWLSNDTQNRKRVSMLAQNFQVQHISTPWVEQIIQSVDDTNILDNYATTLVVENKTFYILNISVNGNSTRITLAYDIEGGNWYRWKSDIFTNTKLPLSGSLTNTAAGNINWQNEQDGKVYATISNWTTDGLGTGVNAAKVTMSVTTPLLDFGTNARKFCNSIEVVHMPNSMLSGNTILPNVYLAWTDDDYTSFVTVTEGDLPPSGRQLSNRANNTQPISYLPRLITRQCGTFRRRAFKVIQSLDPTFRSAIPILEYLEIDIDIGESSSSNLPSSET